MAEGSERMAQRLRSWLGADEQRRWWDRRRSWSELPPAKRLGVGAAGVVFALVVIGASWVDPSTAQGGRVWITVCAAAIAARFLYEMRRGAARTRWRVQRAAFTSKIGSRSRSVACASVRE
jgi:hypothetical protein